MNFISSSFGLTFIVTGSFSLFAAAPGCSSLTSLSITLISISAASFPCSFSFSFCCRSELDDDGC